MHYKNGRPAKVGDRLLSQPSYSGTYPCVGIVTSITPGSKSCNAQVALFPNGGFNTVTLGDCLLLEDVGVKPFVEEQPLPG